MSKTLKVMHVLQSSRFSGAENVACQIIAMMGDDSHFESVYCSTDGQIREALRERGIPFEPMSRLGIKELRRVLQRVKPNLIHAHDMRATLTAVMSAPGIPIVSHIHINYFDSRRISPKSIGFLFAARKAKKIIWVSQSAENGYFFHNILEKKSVVLKNVINSEIIKEQAKEQINNYFDIIFVGRLVKQKNPQKLLRICQLVKTRFPNLQVAVIGDGPLRAELESLSSTLGMDGNVHFLGFQENPYKFLAHSKVFVMASDFEGLPMAVLEAMSLGIPIVSTPTDGVKEVVLNGVTGFLHEDEEVLALKIIDLLENTFMYNYIRKNTIQHFIEINNLNNYSDTIKRVYFESIEMD